MLRTVSNMDDSNYVNDVPPVTPSFMYNLLRDKQIPYSHPASFYRELFNQSFTAFHSVSKPVNDVHELRPSANYLVALGERLIDSCFHELIDQSEAKYITRARSSRLRNKVDYKKLDAELRREELNGSKRPRLSVEPNNLNSEKENINESLNESRVSSVNSGDKNDVEEEIEDLDGDLDKSSQNGEKDDDYVPGPEEEDVIPDPDELTDDDLDDFNHPEDDFYSLYRNRVRANKYQRRVNQFSYSKFNNSRIRVTQSPSPSVSYAPWQLRDDFVSHLLPASHDTALPTRLQRCPGFRVNSSGTWQTSNMRPRTNLDLYGQHLDGGCGFRSVTIHHVIEHLIEGHWKQQIDPLKLDFEEICAETAQRAVAESNDKSYAEFLATANSLQLSLECVSSGMGSLNRSPLSESKRPVARKQTSGIKVRSKNSIDGVAFKLPRILDENRVHINGSHEFSSSSSPNESVQNSFQLLGRFCIFCACPEIQNTGVPTPEVCYTSDASYVKHLSQVHNIQIALEKFNQQNQDALRIGIGAIFGAICNLRTCNTCPLCGRIELVRGQLCDHFSICCPQPDSDIKPMYQIDTVKHLVKRSIDYQLSIFFGSNFETSAPPSNWLACWDGARWPLYGAGFNVSWLAEAKISCTRNPMYGNLFVHLLNAGAKTGILSIPNNKSLNQSPSKQTNKLSLNNISQRPGPASVKRKIAAVLAESSNDESQLSNANAGQIQQQQQQQQLTPLSYQSQVKQNQISFSQSTNSQQVVITNSNYPNNNSPISSASDSRLVNSSTPFNTTTSISNNNNLTYNSQSKVGRPATNQLAIFFQILRSYPDIMEIPRVESVFRIYESTINGNTSASNSLVGQLSCVDCSKPFSSAHSLAFHRSVPLKSGQSPDEDFSAVVDRAEGYCPIVRRCVLCEKPCWLYRIYHHFIRDHSTTNLTNQESCTCLICRVNSYLVPPPNSSNPIIDLGTHLRIFHNICLTEKADEDSEEICPQCFFVGTSHVQLREHMLFNGHRYTCPFCSHMRFKPDRDVSLLSSIINRSSQLWSTFNQEKCVFLNRVDFERHVSLFHTTETNQLYSMVQKWENRGNAETISDLAMDPLILECHLCSLVIHFQNLQHTLIDSQMTNSELWMRKLIRKDEHWLIQQSALYSSLESHIQSVHPAEATNASNTTIPSRRIAPVNYLNGNTNIVSNTHLSNYSNSTSSATVTSNNNTLSVVNHVTVPTSQRRGRKSR